MPIDDSARLSEDDETREFMAVLDAAPHPLDEETVSDLIAKWYEIGDNIVGGSLHIVLDDGNTRRSDIEHCKDWALERGDAAGAKFAEALLTLTDEQMKAWLALATPDAP